jgi:hypothetical protein
MNQKSAFCDERRIELLLYRNNSCGNVPQTAAQGLSPSVGGTFLFTFL